VEPWQLLVLGLAGLASGFLNVMAGGGSLLTVPIMVFMGIPGPVANGTNRIAILAQNLTATITFFRRGYSDFKLSLSLAACAIPGAAVGALLGTRLEGAWFNYTIAAIMVGVILITWLGRGNSGKGDPQSRPSRARMLWGHLLMVGVGFYGGFIQLGVGFIIMPVLNRVMGFDLVTTNMHKVFIIGSYTAVALLIFAARVEMLWLVGAIVAVGNSVGGWLATRVQIKQGEGIVRTVLNAVLLVFIVKLLFFGEIVGLLGHNGAGKTTIMKMLSGYLEPSSGAIEIGGIDLAENTRGVQQILGYLPENLPVYPDMTVADYLDYAATLKGLQGEALRDSVRRAVRDTELFGKLLDPIATLSRGYKQRVGVAQAVLGSPRVLILDEPTNGLDPNQTQHMRDLIVALAKNATVILSTHIMQEVDAICDRALILRNGHLALDENLADLRAAGQLILKTSLAQDEIEAVLPAHTSISVSSAEFGKHEYHLALAEGAEADAAAAAIAAAVLGAGGELYQLHAQVRDLETVFREVNLQEGIAHAA
jgi:ABC-2 type transport system ATP-binding protein